MPPSKQCNSCDSINATLRCSRCQAVSYCSKECQKKDWKSHKQICRPITAAAATNKSRGGENAEQTNHLVQPLDLQWIRNAIIDEETDELLQESYDDPECSGRSTRLLTQRDEFMKEMEQIDKKVAKATIYDLQAILLDETVVATTEALIDMWNQDCIDITMQNDMDQRLERALYKANFILLGILLQALKSQSSVWISLRSKIVDMCFSILRKLKELAGRVPHPGGSELPPVILHLRAMKFLCEISLGTWAQVIYDSKIKLSSSQVDEFIPLMRQLCMVKCLDKEFNMYGPWNEILNELSNHNCAGKIKRIEADAHLDRITTQLNRACNSMQCKIMSLRSSDMPDFASSFMYEESCAPQRWNYFPKCSNMHCYNIETKERPHLLRCTKCYYFHWCSEACKTLSCDRSNQHQSLCSITPAKKAKQTKAEMEAFLDIGKKNSNSGSKICHGCGMKEKGDTDKKFFRGGHRNNVWYCSKLCDTWDQEEGGNGN